MDSLRTHVAALSEAEECVAGAVDDGGDTSLRPTDGFGVGFRYGEELFAKSHGKADCDNSISQSTINLSLLSDPHVR